MKPKPIAGGPDLPDAAPAQLDLSIDRKAFRASSGEPVEVLREFALEAPAGSFTAMIGPSGCGKTTTLRIAAGLDRDFEGRVSPDPDGLRIGYVFQEPRLLPWRSVERNIRLAMPPRDRDADLRPLLDSLGIADVAERFPAELSLGMARRVALARAFSVSPQILFLDEPFVSLDGTIAARLRNLLADRLREVPVTVLMVTHDVREAVELADRIALMAPRPSRVIDVYDVPMPRAARDGAVVGALVAELATRFPGTVHPMG